MNLLRAMGFLMLISGLRDRQRCACGHRRDKHCGCGRRCMSGDPCDCKGFDPQLQ